MLDLFYISFYSLWQPKLKRKTILLAYHYICIAELAFYLLIVSFFIAFSSQLNLGSLSFNTAVTLTVFGILFVYIKNWMRYNGKLRNVLSAKGKKVDTWKLYVLPIACVVLTFVFYQAI